MLPSQYVRPTSSRAHMYRRHRGRRIPMIVGLAIVLVCGLVVFKLWPGSPSLSEADAAPGAKSPETNKPTGPEPAMMTALLDPKPPAPSPKTPPANVQPKVNMGPAAHEAPSAPPENPKPAAPVVAPPQNQTKAPTTPPNPPAPNISRGESISSSPAAGASASTTGGPATQRLNTGMDLLARNKPVDARKMLSEALQTPGLTAADADRIRTTLTNLNEKLVFGRDVAANDPFARVYAIESGDVLAKLPRKLSLNVDWRFLQRINDMPDPQFIQVGQKIKVVTGPFHAVVRKPEFRMDLYMGNGDERVYVRSYAVGLGEFDATPEGVFSIRASSKLINPEWVNPRTGERFYADDPNNPIGERWIGLVGVSENIRDLAGYGIHGTIEPQSIGQSMSMGCVRMNADDVNVIYELLMENVSRVEIHGEDYP